MEMLQKSNSAHDFSKFEILQKNLETSMNIIIESKNEINLSCFDYLLCIEYYSGFNNAVSVLEELLKRLMVQRL